METYVHLFVKHFRKSFCLISQLKNSAYESVMAKRPLNFNQIKYRTKFIEEETGQICTKGHFFITVKKIITTTKNKSKQLNKQVKVRVNGNNDSKKQLLKKQIKFL